MIRVNVYRLLPSAEDSRLLRVLGDRVAALWNVAQYDCRHAYLHHASAPSYAALCSLLRLHPTYRALSSDMAQEVLKKVRESWRSYFVLAQRFRAGRIPQKPRLPGYWKDRRTGHRLCRCIPIKAPRSYRVDAQTFAVTLPADLRPGRLEIPVRGATRYHGKLGRAEVSYDATRRRWYLRVSVDLPQPDRQPRPVRHAAADRGARIGLAVAIEGVDQVALFRMREAWKDYRYWSREIAAEQRHLALRGQRSSRRLRRLYLQRAARLQTAYRALARTVVRRLQQHHVTDLTVGDFRHIREAMNFGGLNELVHNFWAFDHALALLKDACERVGIRLHGANERGTSSHCALCAEPTPVVRPIRSRVQCPYGHQLHADVAGACNLLRRTTHDPEVRGRAGGRPRWTTCRWNGHRWVATESAQRRNQRAA